MSSLKIEGIIDETVQEMMCMDGMTELFESKENRELAAELLQKYLNQYYV